MEMFGHTIKGSSYGASRHYLVWTQGNNTECKKCPADNRR